MLCGSTQTMLCVCARVFLSGVVSFWHHGCPNYVCCVALKKKKTQVAVWTDPFADAPFLFPVVSLGLAWHNGGTCKRHPTFLNQNRPMEVHKQSEFRTMDRPGGVGGRVCKLVLHNWCALWRASNRWNKIVVTAVKDFCCNLLIRVWGDQWHWMIM